MRVENNFTNLKFSSKLTDLTRKVDVHILDNGEHASSMYHFAQSLFAKRENVNLMLDRVEINTKKYDVKFVDSIESVLKSLNLKKGDFVTIPALASVNIRNLQERLESVLGFKETLSPKNLLQYKNKIMELLKAFTKNKELYIKDYETLDMHGQNFDRIYPLLQSINELTEKGVNVYIPTNPDDYPIKGVIDMQKSRLDLYAYIAKGIDDSGEVAEIIKSVKDSDIYNFNLFALANAHIVDVLGIDNEKYIFGARDGYANDSARGVYNFTPIRNSQRELLGFSFHDDVTPEYKADEFPGMAGIANLLEYVGYNIRDFRATNQENAKLKTKLSKGEDVSELPNKLYRIQEVFEDREIEANRYNLLGDYITKEKDLVFDVNKKEQILFQKSNCEGSQRPSVVSMWGPCFSTIKAIERDIDKV